MGNGIGVSEQHRPSISQGGSPPDQAWQHQTLADVLHQAAQAPHGILYVPNQQDHHRQSYAELLDQAQRILGGLRAQGWQPQQPVILQLADPQAFFEGLWACFLGGFIPVPMVVPPSYAVPNSKANQLQHAQALLDAPLILTELDLEEPLQQFTQHHGHASPVIAISRLKTDLPASDYYRSQPDELALILMTSGSTGQPKGVMLSVENLLGSAMGMATVNQFSAAEITLNWMPLEHVASLVMFHFTEVCLGCEQIQVANERVLQDPLQWLALVDRYRATATWAPNFAYGLVNERAADLEAQTWDLSCLRWMGSGAEAVVGQTTQRFLKLLHPYGLSPMAVRPGYGMSETCSGIVHAQGFTPITDANGMPFVEVGAPIPGVAIRIVDERDQVVPEGVVGALQVQGITVTQGYYNCPEQTEALFTPDGWLRTGDLGWLRAGQLTITGRQKEVILIHGVNYSAHDIEAVVESIPGVAVSYTAACAVRLSEQVTEQLAIFFHTSVTDKDGLVALLRQVRKTVILDIGVNPEYLLPVAAADIPKTSVGKIQRSQLRDQFQSGQFQAQLDRVQALLVDPDRPQPSNEIEQQLACIWQTVLGVKGVGIDDNFFELGGTSIQLLQVLSRTQTELGRDLSVVDLFQYPSIRGLARFLSQEQAVNPALQRAQTRGETRRQAHDAPDIAVVGMACRFPGAQTIDEFWQNLADGIESITFFSDAEILATGIDPSLLHQRGYVKASPILEDVASFDAEFFGYTAKEAALLDPQQRLLLECAWESLEDAGYNPWAYTGAIALYAGASMNTYVLNHVYPNRHELDRHDDLQVFSLSSMGGFQMTVANDKDYLTTRVSYKLNLRGPSVNVQTACSTSLVAIHMASQSLLNGECEMALAGGVSVHTPQKVGYLYQEGMILSPDGHCRAFDAQAQGTLFGSGAGMVVLKRLDDAIANQDHIYAVIKGSAVANDGGDKVGFLAPQAAGQAVVTTEAMAMAGVSADSIDFVEAHGTGTELGDPIEVAALTQAFRLGSQRQQFCALGSVKTNVGHLNIASGVVGFIKTVLALHHRQIPPSLHFETPNPRIDFEHSPFFVNTALRDWPQTATPRRAGVNSLGIGGSNVHVILEEAPPLDPPAASEDRPLHLLTLSARAAEALRSQVQQMITTLQQQPDCSLADLCFTRNVGRAHFRQRLALVAASVADVQTQLANWLTGQLPLDCEGQVSEQAHSLKIALLFTGQGSQLVAMGQQLYETQPVFRAVLEACDRSLRPYLDIPLLTALYPNTRSDQAPLADEGESLIHQTAYTQPALFALEYALYRLWQSWGIEPNIVMGHSVGEYIAACVAGVFSLDDGLKLIAARGRLMQGLPTNGGMVAVMADQATVTPIIQQQTGLAIAALNGPQSLVLSGERSALEAAIHTLTTQGIKTTPLCLSHAFHSPLMEPILDAFAQVAHQIDYHPPQIELISNLTGQPAGPEIASPDYWVQQIRQPVQFAASIAQLTQAHCDAWIECGPQPTLLGMAKPLLNARSPQPCLLPSLRRHQSDWSVLLQSLSQLYVQGADINWPAFDDPYPRRRLSLPTYPFQRQRHWIEPPLPQPVTAPAQTFNRSAHPLLGSKLSTPLQQTLFQAQIHAQAPSFLADHQIQEVTVFPGSAYLEMALAAMIGQGQALPLTLQNITIEQVLSLNSAPATLLQTVLEGSAAHITVAIFSQAVESDTWQKHWTGTVAVAVDLPPEPVVSLAELRGCFAQERSVADHYRECCDRTLHYGPSFQGIQRLWVSSHAALGYIQLPASLDPQPYTLHPALLDASCQLILAALPAENKALYVPIALDRCTVYRAGDSQVWSHIQLQPQVSDQQVVADLTLFNPEGDCVARLTGLTAHRLDAAPLTEAPDWQNWLYQLEWRRQPPTENTTDLPPGHWLIFADPQGIAAALATILRHDGQTCTLVTPGPCYQHTDQGIQINPQHPGDYPQLFADGLPSGIIYLWSLYSEDRADLTSERLAAATRWTCETPLLLFQTLLKQTEMPRLYFITQGSQCIHPGWPEDLTGLAQAPLWGMVRSVNLEHPHLQAVVLDLDLRAPVAQAAHGLAQELAQMTPELQVAFRGGQRFCGGLAPYTAPAAALPQSEPVSLEILTRGTLDSLVWQPRSRQTPQANEVEIQVQATGLNFRDVLNVLGEYPGNPGAPGLECAGFVVAVGPDVDGVAVGDRVVAIAPHSFSQYVTVPVTQISPQPAGLTAVEAATLPVAYMTAYYALRHLGRMGECDRILIHSAAGGVGLAAVQIAQQTGAEIYATASPDKWAYLKSLGLRHIFNSRTLEFADQIQQITQGAGVTHILNSFSGDFIAANLSVLSPNGHFLEIGKQGIWSPAQITQRRPDLHYCIIDLMQIMADQPQFTHNLLQTVMAEFLPSANPKQTHSAFLAPLPHQVFPADQVVDAFRTMQQAKHIGKIVVTPQTVAPAANNPLAVQLAHAQAAAPSFAIHPDGTYLITGGLGALGQQVAAWLASQGAEQVLLVSRRDRPQPLPPALSKLEQEGLQIEVVTADVADLTALSQALAPWLTAGARPRLRGVFHLAGLLADGTLTTLTGAAYQQVMAPKVLGAWHLHQLTQHLTLDCFVLFSSAASLLGSAGQTNYAAANAFLDQLAHTRQTLGQPGLSISWGPWAIDGMASPARIQQHLNSIGMAHLSAAQGLAALDTLLHRNAAHVGVLPMNGQWSTSHPSVRFWSKTVDSSSPINPANSDWLGPLTAAEPQDRPILLKRLIRLELAKLIGVPAAQLTDNQAGFTQLGLDSLTTIELRNVLQMALDLPLPATLAYDYPNLEKLTVYLLARLFPEPEVWSQPMAGATIAVETLSETEAEALLLQELERLTEL